VISIGLSIWDMGYRYGIWDIDMVIYHTDMVILDIDMEYGLIMCEMKVSIRSSSISIWDILLLCLPGATRRTRGAPRGGRMSRRTACAPPAPRGLHTSTSQLNLSRV